MSLKPFIVGITGGTASGKTFVIQALKDYFESHILVVSQDQYYKTSDAALLERWERVNLDEPKAFDNRLLVEHLKELQSGHEVKAPVYNYATHSQELAKITLEPKPVIVLEGILIFHEKELRKMMDWKVFLEASPDIRLARRLLRDIDERGIEKTKLHADIERYVNIVKPMYDQYIQPYRKHADIVYNTDRGSLYAAQNVIDRLKKVYKKHKVDIEDKNLAFKEYDFNH